MDEEESSKLDFSFHVQVCVFIKYGAISFCRHIKDRQAVDQFKGTEGPKENKKNKKLRKRKTANHDVVINVWLRGSSPR